jgi:hypothetical protein
MEALFDQLLQELGQLLNLTLKPDRVNVCQLKYKDGVQVQLEIEKDEKKLLIATKIGSLPPGRFRQEFLEQALKANSLPPPRAGIFAFAKHENELVYFTYLPLKDLKGQQIYDALAPFLEKTRFWRTALAENTIPSIVPVTGPAKPAGIFGLTP